MSTPPVPPGQPDPYHRPPQPPPDAYPDPYAAPTPPIPTHPTPAQPPAGPYPAASHDPNQPPPAPNGPGGPGAPGPESTQRFWPDAPGQDPYASGTDPYAGERGAGRQPNPFVPGGVSDPYGVPGPQAPYPELPIPPPMQRADGGSRRPATRAAAAVVPLGIGAAVAVALGVYGRVHDPTGVAINIAGFSSTQSVKTWLATVAVVLAIVQLVSAFAVYGRIPGPSWSGTLHKWSGRLAVLFTLPVVAHCLYALGFQYDTGRVLIHSLLGCFFFGAFAAKMLVLSRDDAPRGLLPVIGGVVFSALVGLWLTSSLWFFTTVGFTF